jgi:hypothetical protein
METKGVEWAEEEMLRVLALYAAYPDGKVPKAKIAELAKIMPGRSVATISLRIANFSARDPKKIQEGLKGLMGGGKKASLVVDKYLKPSGEFDLHKLLLDCAISLK